MGPAAQDDGWQGAEAEKEWATALLTIHRKDPCIYDASTRLFASEPSTSGAQGERTKHKDGNGKTLREVLYLSLIHI